MSDYISRQAAFEALEKRGVSTTNISRVPIADVREDVRGEWRDIQIGNWHGVECTACKIAYDGRDVPRKNRGIVAWNFCPHCGADMRGDNNGQRNDS